MIDSSFLCASSWDFLGSDENSIFKDKLKDELDCGRVDSVGFSDLSNSFEGDNLLPSNSISFPNVYECISDDIDDLIPLTDPLISEILDDGSTEFQEFNWSALIDNTEACSTPITNDSVTLQISSTEVKKSTQCKSSTLWSKMSPEEQLKTLHVLSEIVTCRMGIKEQMEVIKIIDPSVEISPNDTEFALDSSSLNDRKMKKIRSFFLKHGFHLNNGKVSSSSSNLYLSEKPSLASKIFSRKSSRTKRRQKKHKMCASKDVLQKSKLELHGQKEAQSGLFVYEKVIKKLSNPSEEEEDVNILE